MSNMGLMGKKDGTSKPKDGTINAKDIVKNPDIISLIPGKYVIISDRSDFGNLTKAINIMAKANWKCIARWITINASIFITETKRLPAITSKDRVF
ncbi:MAG: hypothetical protein ABR985_20820 [Methanotrichaceae archaeon]